MPSPKLIHFTEGGPWHGYSDQEHVQLWMDEFENFMFGDNPAAGGYVTFNSPNGIRFEGGYDEQTK